jgi:hypothetical protein
MKLYGRHQTPNRWELRIRWWQSFDLVSIGPSVATLPWRISRRNINHRDMHPELSLEHAAGNVLLT